MKQSFLLAALVALALLCFVVAGDPTTWWSWLGLAALVGASPLLLPAHSRIVVPLSLALPLYHLGARLPASFVAAGALLLLAGVAALVSRQRALLMAVLLPLVAALGLVLFVLFRSPWQGDATSLLALTTGLAAAFFGAAVGSFLWARATRRRTAAVMALAVAGLTGTTGALTGALASAGGESTLGYGPTLASLRALDRCEGPAALPLLDRLRVAGFADAGHALVGAALTDNIDLTWARRFCPRAHRTAGLGEACATPLELGREVCGALRASPEDGAARLQKGGKAALLRVAAELLLQSGDIEGALTLTRRAAAAGDPYAARNAVRALIDLGRTEQAQTFAAASAPGDPFVALFLSALGEESTSQGQTPPASLPRALDSKETMSMFAAQLRFDGLLGPTHIGVRARTVPGDLLPVWDAGLGRWVLSSVSRYVESFTVDLPLPPARRVPELVRLSAKSRRIFGLLFENDSGERLLYSCGFTMAGAAIGALPRQVCDGSWGSVVVPVASKLKGPLRRWALAGEFSVMDLRIADSEVGP